MTRHLSPAVEGSAVLILGSVMGLWMDWTPPGLVIALGALGLALRGRWGWKAALLAIGLLSGDLQQGSILSPAADRPAVLRLEVTGAWQGKEDGVSASARTLWIRQGLDVRMWRQDVRLVLPPGTPPPEWPDLRVRGYLRRPAAPANGVDATPGRWVLRVKSSRFVSPVRTESGSIMSRWRAAGVALREPIEERLAELEKSTRGLGPGLVRVLVLGQSGSLPGPVARGLRSAGLAHLVALSGLHVGLLVGLAWMATSKASQGCRFGVSFSLAVVYILVAGIRPSLLRATLMMMAVLGSLLLRRPPRAFNTLAWVAAAMVVVEPRVVARIGFQLTVAATGGILLLAPRLERRWSRLPEFLRQPLSVSVGAHLAVLPWSLSQFHLATPMAPLWNLLAVPWAALALSLSFAWVAASFCCAPLGQLAARGLDLLATPLLVFGSLAPDRLGAVPVRWEWWMSTLLAGSIFLVLSASGWRPRLLGGVAAVVLLLASLRPEAPDPELVMLDVGQGEAILLRDGEESYLLDGGGWRRADIAQKILLPALTRLGVRSLQGMILSHPDTDHCGGLLALSSYMPVRRLYTSAGWWNDPCVLSLLGRPGLEIRPLWRGEDFHVGRWEIQVLHPPAGSRSGRNDRSLVLLAEVERTRVLLTGDLEAEGEREILAALRAPESAFIDIAKIGHHGSKTSTTTAWLDVFRPRIALVSCGVGNRYGHPNPGVLRRLEDRDIRILRTDLLGMIHISVGKGGRQIRMRFPGMPRASSP